MTPFGQYVRELRQQRRVTLKEMASEVKLNASYLSALENGRKGAPSRKLVDQIARYFSLSPKEYEELQGVARASATFIRVPSHANPDEYRLIAQLLEKLGMLSRDHISGIAAILSLEDPKLKTTKARSLGGATMGG